MRQGAMESTSWKTNQYRTHPDKAAKKKKNLSEDKLGTFGTTSRRIYSYTGVPGGEEGERGRKETSPNLWKETDFSRVQEAQSSKQDGTKRHEDTQLKR